VLLLAVTAAVRALRQSRSAVQRAAMAAVLAGLGGYLVQGQFLFEHVVSLLFWAVAIGLVGCSAVQVAPAASEAPSSTGGRQPRPEGSKRREASRLQAAQRAVRSSRDSARTAAVHVAAATACIFTLCAWNARPLAAEWDKMHGLQRLAGPVAN